MPTDYKIISKIQAPDGSIYEIKPSENANINTDGIYYVSATGTASALTGTINDLDAYYNGLKIVLYNGSGVNTNATCTLKINDLAAVSIKKNGTTNVGTIYNKTIAVLCYVDGVFYHNNYYDSNTTEDSFYVRYLATDTANVLQYSLCALTDNDKISSFTTNTSASTNTGKSVTTLAFRMGFPIFYRAGSTINANTTTTDYYALYENKKTVDIRYSMCYYNASRISATGPTYLYMNVEVGNGTYTPKKQATSVSNVQDHIVCKGLTINELIDGNFYIYLGICSSTSAKYTMDFAQDNPLYYYDGTNDMLIGYDTWKNNQQDSSISDIEDIIFEMEDTMASLQDQITTNVYAIDKLARVSIRDCSINAYTTLGAESLCMLDTSGNLTGLVTSYSTGTGKTLSTDVTDTSISFRLGCDIFKAGRAYEAGDSIPDLSTLSIQGQFDARYSSVYPSISTSGGLDYGATNKSMVFMPINIDFATKTFKLMLINPSGASGTTYRTNLLSINKLVNGYYYMFIGYRRKSNSVASDTYIVDLVPNHPIYYYEAGGLVPLELRRDGMIEEQIGDSTYEHRAVATYKMNTKYDISSGSFCMISKDKELCTFSQSQTGFTLIPNTVKFDMDAVVYIYDDIDKSAGYMVDNKALLQATKSFAPLKTSNTVNIANARVLLGVASGKYNAYMPINLDESDGSFSLTTVEATNGTNTYTTNIVSDSETAYSFPTGFYKLLYKCGGGAIVYAQMPLYNPVYYYDGTSFIPYNVWKNNQQDTSISDVNTLLQDVSTHVSLIDASVTNIYDTSLTFLNMNTVKDSSIAVGAYPLNKDSLCMVATDGKLYPFVTQATTTNTTSSGSGAYNTIPDTIKFRIGTDVFIAGKTYSANTLAVDVSSLYMSKEVDIRYSTRYISTSGSGYAIDSSNSRNRVFLCINIDNEHGEFTINKTYLSSGGWMLPIVAESQFTSLCAEKFYMFLGYASKRSDYKSVWISPKHPIYYYDGTRFIEYNAYMHDKHDQLLDGIDQHLSIIDTSITYLETASGNNGWGELAPIAGQNIYASEEYPAIVYLDYVRHYNEYHTEDPSYSCKTDGLIYDIAYIGSGASLNINWGYAILTHDVSAGQRVDPKYLHRKWTYPLHTNLSDLTKQGLDFNEFTEMIEPSTGTYPSFYRYMDASLSAFITDTVTMDPSTLKDGPWIYMVHVWNKFPIYDYDSTYDPEIGPPVIGYHYTIYPGSHFAIGNTTTAIEPDTGPFHMAFSYERYYSFYSGPIFSDFGKVNFNTLNGTPASISLDFSNTRFQAYDASGNTRSLPGYPYSAGVSILKDIDDSGSGGGSGGGDSINLTPVIRKLQNNITPFAGNQDVSVLIMDLPQAGFWKIDAQVTLQSSVTSVVVDCFISFAEPDAGQSISEFTVMSASTIALRGYTNVFMSTILECSAPLTKVLLSIYPRDSAATVVGSLGAANTSTNLHGNDAATQLIAYRVAPYTIN